MLDPPTRARASPRRDIDLENRVRGFCCCWEFWSVAVDGCGLSAALLLLVLAAGVATSTGMSLMSEVRSCCFSGERKRRNQKEKNP